MKNFFIGLGCFLAFIAFIFFVNEFNIFGVKFWGVRSENARREVFEQTQSYVEGKRQELVKYHHEWTLADADSKIIIENTIRQSFANVDDKIFENSPELYSFLTKIKNN